MSERETLFTARRRIEELEAALANCRKERDEIYAVNAAANYVRANLAEDALQDILALCEPDRVPLPLLNSQVVRRIREVLGERADV